MSPDELAARVATSCASSGVPVRVTDALAVAGIAALLQAPAERSRAHGRQAEHAAGRRRSQPPRHLHAVGVERSRSLRAGADGDAGDEGAHDSDLPIKVEPGPLLP